jgi:hypothetical protein
MTLKLIIRTGRGIVMAADSCSTFCSGDGKEVFKSSNYANKLFLTKGGVGIDIGGDDDCNGMIASAEIEKMMRDKKFNTAEPAQVAKQILAHFRSFEQPPDSHFFVCGYTKQSIAEMWSVHITNNKIKQFNIKPGISCGGESDIVTRLTSPMYEKISNSEFVALPHYRIPYETMTLQDAINLAVLLISTTAELMEIQLRQKTVGGPIDVLVLAPDKSRWIKRKRLKVIP